MEPLLSSGPRTNGNTVESDVFYVVRSETTSLDRPSWVHLVQSSAVERFGWWVSELVRELLRFSLCELLLLEDSNWCKEIMLEPRVRGTTAFGSRYQATIGEDTAD
jgi:hypothetical protein